MHTIRSRGQLAILRGLLTALVLATASCASAAGGTENTASNPNILTAAEIARGAASQGTAYDALRRLRPQFLQTRGQPESAGTEPSILVSIDGGSLTRVDALQSIAATMVREIRYLNASEALQRFGLLAQNGPVILVLQQR